jgi:Na+/H+ antiporter NhaC
MGEAFHHGGWGMYPTTIFGLVLLVTAIRYAIAPDAMRALVVRRLSLLTFISGCLGFTVGCIKCFTHATELPAAELGNAVVGGIGESLNNVALALCMLAITGIAMAVGAARRPSAGDELIAPSV